MYHYSPGCLLIHGRYGRSDSIDGRTVQTDEPIIDMISYIDGTCIYVHLSNFKKMHQPKAEANMPVGVVKDCPLSVIFCWGGLRN